MSIITNDNVRSWMGIDLRQHDVNGRRYHIQQERKVLQDDSDINCISQLFEVFDYEKRGLCRAVDLPIILKALGCDDGICSRSEIKMYGSFTLEDLIPVALEALRIERNINSTEASSREVFSNLCNISHVSEVNGNIVNNESGDIYSSNYEGSDHINSGLNAECLETVFSMCGVRATMAEVLEIISFADLDGDGVIGVEDWIKVMSYLNELTL